MSLQATSIGYSEGEGGGRRLQRERERGKGPIFLVTIEQRRFLQRRHGPRGQREGRPCTGPMLGLALGRGLQVVSWTQATFWVHSHACAVIVVFEADVSVGD